MIIAVSLSDIRARRHDKPGSGHLGTYYFEIPVKATPQDQANIGAAILICPPSAEALARELIGKWQTREDMGGVALNASTGEIDEKPALAPNATAADTPEAKLEVPQKRIAGRGWLERG